ncbi:MAG: PilT/PilU family type 4a pilus ATPase [Planctomycetes bacterium]|nr:PilT/PilU family type 4a pilus ATPase [Planctomycetota bacterium]
MNTQGLGPIEEYLSRMSDLDASDLFLAVGAPPSASVNRRLVPLSAAPLSEDDLRTLAAPFLKERTAEFEKKPDLDLAVALAGKGRFRLNIYRQRNNLGIVARRVKVEIPTIEGLGLPPVLLRLSLEKRGVLFVTGATGSGKSTTLAAMIDHRNQSMDGHIVTIEDPIEFVHPHRKSIVTQREVGIDTATYLDALKSALRQAPDMLLIGEIRDRETAEAALHFGETGHLVMATLHSTNAAQTLERIMNLFPEEAHAQVRMLLSLNLVGIVSQRLIPTSDGRARFAAFEVLLPTPRVRDLIKQWDIGGIKVALADGGEGMQSFDEALYRLTKAGRLAFEDAVLYADSPNDFRLRFRLEKSGEERPRMGLK